MTAALSCRASRREVVVSTLATATSATVATVCVILCLLVLQVYPLPAWPLAFSLATYAAALWRRNGLFLLVLPVVLAAYDLGLWTGWMTVGESDLFILTTVAVLLLRAPLNPRDFLPGPGCRFVLLLLVASFAASCLVGLASPLGLARSDNGFLRPDNALRLFKGLGEALLLLPFLRWRQRTTGDVATLFGWGAVLGLGVVAMIVLAERILFASMLDFSTEYRVAGPFFSMRVGGGHIGAYVALALPFALCLFRIRPRWLGLNLGTIACILGGYTLIVTFARTAYAAGAVALVVTGLGLSLPPTVWSRIRLWSGSPQDGSRPDAVASAASQRGVRSMAAGLTPIVLVLAVLVIAASATGMQTRFASSAMDLVTRRDNWQAGLAVRDDTIATTLFGMGLGTYQRAMLTRSPVNRPSDLAFGQDDAGRFVSMRVETPFFLGQKITLPNSGALHLTMQARATDRPASVSLLLCDKVLLYSDNCRGPDAQVVPPEAWTTVAATVAVDGLGGGALSGLLHRPVEFSISGAIGQTIAVRAVSLTDDAGHAVLLNGDFADGLDRWIFTDDSHVSWRMLNQYLMLFFETGSVGLTAFLALAGAALAGGLVAPLASRGNLAAGRAATGAIAGFLVSCLFDNVLEAPRIATLFFLVCWCGLLQWETRSGRQ